VKVGGKTAFQVTGFKIDYTKCMFCALCVDPCPVDCIFMGSTFDISTYSRDGCIVDYAKLPLEIAWGQATRNPTAAAAAKRASEDDESVRALEAELEEGRGRMEELVNELHGLGVLLKDYFTGLLDFPCWMDGREVYLCWKLDEPEVGHWHEVDAGFAGRRKLM